MISAPALRWAILIVNLEPIAGHEQGGERRALVVSYEAFHRASRVSICPITAARTELRYPHEVAIPAGEAGQTKAAVILCHQVRTISLQRVRAIHAAQPAPVGYLVDPAIRSAVRQALARQFGLDIPHPLDGAQGSAVFRP